MNLILLRHTTVTIEPGLCYGRTEVPVAATFPEEARAVVALLPWTPEVVWSSPAERCRRLAAVLAGSSQPVRIDARLAELDFGKWEGRRWEDFRGPDSEAWAEDPLHRRPPGGESGQDLLARVDAFRRELSGREVRRTAIITHAGVIRAWRSLEAGTPLSLETNLPVPFGSITGADLAGEKTGPATSAGPT